MDLYYLIYTSIPAKPMSDPELQELLTVARDANSRFQVTGVLICLPETFIQLIEGPRMHIEQLYQNIQKDKRHFRITTVRAGTIEQRYFPDWAMALKSQDYVANRKEVLNFHDQKVLQLFDIIEK